MSNLESYRGMFPAALHEQFLKRVKRARAMLRTVTHASRAQIAGCTSFEELGSEAGRWHPVTGVVCAELHEVRRMFIESVYTPVGDWMAPLAQAEALDAALWYGVSFEVPDGLSNDEVVDAAEAVVASLDALLEKTSSSASHWTASAPE